MAGPAAVLLEHEKDCDEVVALTLTNEDLVDAFGLREEDFRGYVRTGDFTINNVDRRCAEFVSAHEGARRASGDEPSPVGAEQLTRYVRQLIAEEAGDQTVG